MRRAILAAALVLAIFWPVHLPAHPGRLDAKGCHTVRQDWRSKDGTRLYKAGTRHCHRVSHAVRLGFGEIILEEPPELLQPGRERAKEPR